MSYYTINMLKTSKLGLISWTSAKINNGSFNDSQAFNSFSAYHSNNSVMLSQILCGNFSTSSLLKDFQAAFFHSSQLEISKLFTPPCFILKANKQKALI